MITKLEGDLRREIDIDGVPHVVTISPSGFLLTVKGRRKGLEIAWNDLVSGDAALATALNASLKANVGAPAAKVASAKRGVPARQAVPAKKAAPLATPLAKAKTTVKATPQAEPRNPTGQNERNGTGAKKRAARR